MLITPGLVPTMLPCSTTWVIWAAFEPVRDASWAVWRVATHAGQVDEELGARLHLAAHGDQAGARRVDRRRAGRVWRGQAAAARRAEERPGQRRDQQRGHRAQ